MELKPGYKQTEVGILPEEWAVKRLGEVATIGTGATPPTSDPSNYGDEFLFVGPVDMGDAKYISKTEKMLSKKGFALSRRFPKDSILFVSIGSTIGKCGIASVELTANQQINAIFPATIFSVDYLFYAVSAAAPRIKAQAGEQAVPIVNKTQFSGTKVGFPPLLEQRTIATALNDVDELLAGLDRLIAKKRDLKQAAMQQLLTGQTRLPGFHGEWEVKRLGDVAAFFKGKGLPKSAISETGAELCIHYGELFTRYPESIRDVLSRTDESVSAFRSVANDVLMPTSDVTPRGLAKASCILIDGVILGGDILVIRSDKRLIHGPFLSFVIRYEETQVLQLVTGSTVFHLYRSDMSNFTFSMPPLPEQSAIAEVLTDMDAELTALDQRRDKTRALKQGMMQELLTGRTRLV
jgi:type I restriction enzyme S subunit